METWTKSPIRELSRSECWDLLAAQRVGRIAFVDDTGPTIIPVNFVVEGENILIATSAYSSLAQHALRGHVAFEVDGADADNQSGWSVLARGHATQATRTDLPPDLADRPIPWVEGIRTFYLRITPAEVTGRRVLPL